MYGFIITTAGEGLLARASAGVSGWKLEMNRPVADMSFSVCLS